MSEDDSINSPFVDEITGSDITKTSVPPSIVVTMSDTSGELSSDSTTEVKMPNADAPPLTKKISKKESTATVEKIEDSFLSCPICYEVYQEPKCLPCLHTLCRDCLSSYIETQGDFGAKRKMGFPCPICKQFVFVKFSSKPLNQWADDIQNNFLIQNMIDSLLPMLESASSGTTTHPSHPPSQPNASAPPQEPEMNRSVPSAPPLRADRVPDRPFDYMVAHYRRMHYPGSSSSSTNRPPRGSAARSGYQWSGISSEYTSPYTSGALSNLSRIIRPSSSTLDLSPSTSSPLTASNFFRNRINSSSDLNRAEVVLFFVEPFVPWVYNYGLGAYHRTPQFSDVCCLPTSSSIVATDYNNCRVVLFERMFPKPFVESTKSVKVHGRPCSIALLDKEKEDCVVVNLQNKDILVFISVPSMRIIREMKTGRNFRSVAVISPIMLIAGSPDRPASIEQIEIDSNYKLKSRHVLVQNGEKWDISSPVHLCMLSSSTFLVSDSDRKSIIIFEITEDSRGRTIAEKRYSIAPRGDRKLRSPGGLVVDNSTGSVYTVDYGSHLVLRITPGDTIVCETLLTRSDNVYKPASVCLGPRKQLCVVDWEGNVAVYKQYYNNT